jgi:NADH-quinone oxidoreductase subunit M
METMTHLLSILLMIPAVGAAVVLFLPGRAIRWSALGIAIFTCLFSLVLLFRVDFHVTQGFGQPADNSVMQLVDRAAWIARFHIDYLVGIDGLSLPLLLLTTFIFPIAIVASWRIEKAIRFYLPLLLLLESAVIGTFISLDGVLFCTFFEFSLLPAYLLIGLWGGPRKEHAALKFFLHMLIGSVLMLTALILIYLNVHSFNLIELPSLVAAKSSASQSFFRASPYLFLLILCGCFIKSAVVPLHTWLADAHVEAPAPLSMLLSAVMLKVGTYGMLRIAYPLFPEAARHLWLVVALVGLGSILYGALCAMGQADLKRLVAFGSISQMGFVLFGIAMLTTASFNGAIFMMIAHGVVVAMMFFIVEIISTRAGHRDLTLLGGLATTMPRFWGFSAAGFFASLGLPGFCLFVAEILILIGTFGALRSDSILRSGNYARRGTIYALAILALIGLILTAGYTLWALQRIFFGPERAEQAKFQDIDDRETTVLAVLAGMAVLLGIFPGVLFFPMTSGTVDAMLRWIDPSAAASHVMPETRTSVN